MGSFDATLEFCDEVVSSAATKEDIGRVLERQPRNENWALTLTRSNDDYMDVSLREDGTFQIQSEENGRVSVVDETLLKSLLLSFLEGEDSWSRQCKWEHEAAGKASSERSAMPKGAWTGVGVTVLVLALVFLRKGAWLAALFALAFPGLIAFAIVSKMREVRRAATWTKGNARIIRSELRSEERKRAGEATRIVTLPAVEYEFSVGFDKFRGNRISIGEIMPNAPQVEEAVKRYPVGASAPVTTTPPIRECRSSSANCRKTSHGSGRSLRCSP